MEKKIEPDEFVKILADKKRNIIYTNHALLRAALRKIISEKQTSIAKFEIDITEKPSVVVEQLSENPGERKFKIYYISEDGGFLTYVLSINGFIRLITVYRTSKGLQQKIYKRVKRGIYI